MYSNDMPLLQALLTKINKHVLNLAELGPLGFPRQAWTARGGSEVSKQSSGTGWSLGPLISLVFVD